MPDSPTAASSATHQSYAQAAAAAVYAAEDVEPLDHLDALRGYEGEVEGSSWPRRRDTRRSDGGGGWQIVAGPEPFTAHLNGLPESDPTLSAYHVFSPGRDWVPNPAGANPLHPAFESNLDGDDDDDEVIDEEDDNEDDDEAEEEYVHDAAAQIEDDRATYGDDGGYRRHLYLGGAEERVGEEGYGEPAINAPWRSLYTHDNGQLRLSVRDAAPTAAQTEAQPIHNTHPISLNPIAGSSTAAVAAANRAYIDNGGQTGVYQDVMATGWEDEDDEATRRRGRGFDFLNSRSGTTSDSREDPSQLTRWYNPSAAPPTPRRGADGNPEPQLQRGGNNMRRRNIGGVIARHLPGGTVDPRRTAQDPRNTIQPAAQPQSQDAQASTRHHPRHAAHPARQRTATNPPPVLSSSTAPEPLIRSTHPLSPARNTRARSGSADSTSSPPSAKRRKIADTADPTPPDIKSTTAKATVDETPSRPTYLSHSTLPADAILPLSFTPPARDSHLALTTYIPLPTPTIMSQTANVESSCPAHLPPSCNPFRTVRARNESAPCLNQPQISFTARPSIRPRTYADTDASSLRTLSPIPPGCGVHYYEIRVLDSGPEGYMSLGWVTKGVNMARLVGWEKGTWGFHADDGRAFEGRGTGKVYGSVWGVGDVIGAGVDFTTRRAFFTKNGTLIGHIFKNLPLTGLHPAVGFRNPRESVAVNFLGPFMYDIDRHVLGIRNGILADVGARVVGDIPQLPKQHWTSVPNRPMISGTIIILETILSTSTSVPESTNLGPTRPLRPSPTTFRSTPPPPPPGSHPLPKTDTDASRGASDDTLKELIPRTSELDDSSRLAQVGFVLDYLGHGGLDKVKSLMLRDLEKRGAIIVPGGSGAGKGKGKEKPVGDEEEDAGTESPAKMIEAVVRGIKGGKRVQLEHVPDSSGRSTKQQLGVRRKMLILDLVAMAANPPAESLTTSETSIEAALDRPSDGEVEINEEAMKAAREIMGMANVEKWDEGEKKWLNESFAVICGLEPGEGVWVKRRGEWSEELREHLREHHNLKPKSHLEQALRYSHALTKTLSEGVNGAAGFVDPKAFLKGYGRK